MFFQNLLASISKGDNSLATISPEVRRNFDKWYSEQIKKSQQQEDQSEKIDPIQEQETSPKISVSPVVSPADHSPNQSIILAPGKTRMRTSFDPDHEIPRLQKWFQDNQHPTREQMLNFLSELNGLDSRKGRRPLDLTNIIYWFKNARAAHRRASKSLDDGSYEVDDNSGHSPTNLDPNIPYLPNKNAVYLLPYAMHPFMTSSDMHDPKEPCDLSQAKKNNSFQNQEKKENIQPLNGTQEKDNSIVNNMDVTKSDNGLNMIIKAVKEEKAELVARPLEVDLSLKQDLPQSDPIDNDISLERNSNQQLIQSPERCSNGGHISDSDDDEYDSDISNDGDSFSSHDDGDGDNVAIKKEHGNDQEYINAQMAHMSGMTSASGQQPLHIPQFPHPLAMHYFPFNTHLFAQQSARYQQQQHTHHPAKMDHNHVHNNNHGHRKRRTRVFIDPLTEIPKLEKWFTEDTHPSAYMIDKYCEELNRSDYRQKFPRLESKNVQLWFKNHRAKVKRMRLSNAGDFLPRSNTPS